MGDRFLDQQTMKMVKATLLQRQLEMSEGPLGINSGRRRSENFLTYFENLAKTRNSKNTRTSWESAARRFVAFAGEHVTFADLTREMLERYKAHLLDDLSPNSAQNFFSRLKTAGYQAVKDGIISSNPATYINIRKESKLPVSLTLEEVRALAKTPCANATVKNAFLFSCFTGLRYSDLVALTWALRKEIPLDKLESIFSFVRDGIRIGFPPKWDEVKASEVIGYGLGYCNTKATLFQALSRASGIPARVHFGLIDIQIMWGILPNSAFPFMPKAGGHSWIEVQLQGQWKSIDSYINDQAFYERALKRLEGGGKAIGYSVALIEGKSSCEFNFGEKGFVHMGAVVEDHGVWEDPADYFASDNYLRWDMI